MRLTIETVILGTATVFTVMPLMVLFGVFPGVTDGPCSGWHGCEGVFDDPSGCVTLWEVVDFECSDNNISKLYTAEHPSNRKDASRLFHYNQRQHRGNANTNTNADRGVDSDKNDPYQKAEDKCYKLPADAAFENYGKGNAGKEGGQEGGDDARIFGPDDGTTTDQEQTLMVMTTTVGGPQSLGDERWTLQRGAAATWAALAPEVITYVAVDTQTSAAPAASLPRILCPSNSVGTPFAESLFMFAAEEARKKKARFAGYSNGDIAFDSSVIDVLKAVGYAIDGSRISNKVLLIGKRLNIFNAEEDARYLEELANDPVDLRSRIRAALVDFSHRETNTWMSENSEDFFFFTPEVFEDWTDLPNFVLGRVGWDSWMAQWAMDNGVDVIDVTKYLHVSHLTGSDGNLAGWGTVRPDRMWNYCAAKHTCTVADSWQGMCSSCFRCKLGSVKQGAWIISRSTSGRLDVVRKPAVTRVERDALEANSRVTAREMMQANELPESSAQMFLEAVREKIPHCETQGTCCSMQGGWAVGMEIDKRLEVRGEVPTATGFAKQTAGLV